MIYLFAFSNEAEQDKFEYLYQKYKNLLLHKAYDILKDYALAEDAVSEAYIRIYRNMHKIDDPASNSSIAFVVTIAKNVSLTMLSKERRIPVEEYDDTQADSFDLEESVLSGISSQQVFAAMEQLGEDLRGAFLLRYAYDYSLKEVGVLLGASENNVAVRLHRAKKKLAQLLEGYGAQ
jgi:RNA polymerase sigma-70 factor (ECF subfamily)